MVVITTAHSQKADVLGIYRWLVVKLPWYAQLMPKIIKCRECGETFTCDPYGDCWCKAYPIVKIPEELNGKGCLCNCVLEKLRQEQKPNTDDDMGRA